MKTLSDKTYLLIPGAQKAGTSWLFNTLRTHPDIALSPIKELHFWGRRDDPNGWAERRFTRKMTSDLHKGPEYIEALQDRLAMQGKIDRYRGYFETRTNDRKIYGEVTPAYSILSRDEWQEITREFPNLKVIFALRDPTARFWSQLKFDNPKLDTPALLELVKPAMARGGYAKRSNYKRTIENIRHVLPDNRMLFLFQEQLDAPTTLPRITDFLGIPPMKSPPAKRANVGPKHDLPTQTANWIAAQLADQYAFVRSEFGDDVPNSWATPT